MPFSTVVLSALVGSALMQGAAINTIAKQKTKISSWLIDFRLDVNRKKTNFY